MIKYDLKYVTVNIFQLLALCILFFLHLVIFYYNLFIDIFATFILLTVIMIVIGIFGVQDLVVNHICEIFNKRLWFYFSRKPRSWN